MSEIAPPPQIYFQDSIRLIQPGAELARVLLFHGLTGTPSEMEDLAKALFAVGCSVGAPLLPGHGRSLSELKATSLAVWRNFAAQEMSRLLEGRPDSVPVFACGLSLGSLLAIDVACSNQKLVTGLILISPPLVFRSKKSAALLEYLSYMPELFLSALGTRKKTARRQGYLAKRHNSFPRHSIGSLARLTKLRRIVLRRIRNISCPTLVLFDPEDHHLRLKGIERVFAALPNDKLVVKEYPGGQHELTLGHDHQAVFNDIIQFILARASGL